jgi:hydrogenase maturation protease
MKPSTSPKILLYGYGNTSRQDDGLAIAFIDRMNSHIIENNLTTVLTDSSYQLNPEDAIMISSYDIVVFIDATYESVNNYNISKVKPTSDTSIFQHFVSPGFLLYLCDSIYQRIPVAYLLEIGGYSWKVNDTISKKAEMNLQKSIDDFKLLLTILMENKEGKLDNSFVSENIL